MTNELWTLLYSSDKRVTFEASTDIIGYCCSLRGLVVVPKVAESNMIDEAFDQKIQDIDPY